MNQYYLMAQLPSLDAVGETAPLPITEERFYDLCSRFLSKKAVGVLNELTLAPRKNAKKTGYSVVDEWNKREVGLRLALGSIRARKMKKSFDEESALPSAQLLQTARTAAEMNDPLSAEMLLNRFRLDLLETLRPSDAFSEETVFYYGLRLKLLSKIRQYDAEKGQTAYRNIYNSVIRGERQETE